MRGATLQTPRLVQKEGQEGSRCQSWDSLCAAGRGGTAVPLQPVGEQRAPAACEGLHMGAGGCLKDSMSSLPLVLFGEISL